MALDLLRWIKHNLIPSPSNNFQLFQRGQLLYIDYKITPKSRYSHGKPPHPKLYELIDSNRQQYIDLLTSFSIYYDRLQVIAKNKPGPGVPTFYTNWYTAQDATMLYCLVRTFKPRRYIEVGSGNSTHFARIASDDENLDLHITSIDPHPRRDIHETADTIIDTYLEDTDLSIFSELERNDIFFLDGSHRSFMNSDVTIAFLEIIPYLKSGVLVQVHDIWIPWDYPQNWADRHYSEQYLLASYLLGGAHDVEVIMPIQFVIHDEELNNISQPLWQSAAFQQVPYGGGVAFWFRKI